MKTWLVVAALAMMFVHDPEQVRALLVMLGACGLLTLLCSVSTKATVFHGHGVTRQDTSFHEAGHAVIARHRGAARVSARVDRQGKGLTRASEQRAIDRAVILAAGTEASSLFYKPHLATTHSDALMLAQVCRDLGITPEQVRRMAQQEVSRHAQEIRVVAEQLNRRGHL
jgi:hypothetical protein